MNNAYEQVKKFHEACGVDMPVKPKYLKGGKDDIPFLEKLEPICEDMRAIKGNPVLFRASLMLEELTEFIDAADTVSQVDSMIDLIYIALGTLTLMGVQPEPVFNIVQAANMAKVGPDGKVIKDAQGKIRKPVGWTPPEEKIKREIERQSNSCETCNGTSKPIYGLECPTCG